MSTRYSSHQQALCLLPDSPPCLLHSPLYIILSMTFPNLSSRQTERYDAGSPSGSLGLVKNVNFCLLHWAGHIPSFRHALKVSAKRSGQVLTSSINALLGVLSPILPHISHSSSSTTGDIMCLLIWTAVCFQLFSWWGNRVATISFRSRGTIPTGF